MEYETDDRDIVSQGRFAVLAERFARVPWTENSNSYWSEASYLSSKICILSAASMLLIFAQDPRNAEAEVIWQLGGIVNAGWAARGNFVAGADRKQTILVATEGASDARILRRALDLLRPGPEGLSNCDINGRAEAIECYLDLNLPGYPPAQVIWSNFKREIALWHGALEHKESYDRHFMKHDAHELASGKYDLSKLNQVLDAMVVRFHLSAADPR